MVTYGILVVFYKTIIYLIYNCPFSIYHDKNPIGFLEVSKIYKTSTTSSVKLSYALIEEERKKDICVKS